MKNIITLLLSILLLTSITACSSGSANNKLNPNTAYVDNEYCLNSSYKDGKLVPNNEDFNLKIELQSANFEVKLVKENLEFIVPSEYMAYKNNVLTIKREAFDKIFELEDKEFFSGNWDVIISSLQGEIIYNKNILFITLAISNYEDLRYFAGASNSVYKGYYILKNDIDAYNYSHTNILPWVTPTNYAETGLTGTFDGRNYAIKGITISTYGLFIVVGNTGKIINLAMIDVFMGNYNSAAIAYWMFNNAEINNVYVRYAGTATKIGEDNSLSGIVRKTFANWGNDTNTSVKISNAVADFRKITINSIEYNSESALSKGYYGFAQEINSSTVVSNSFFVAPEYIWATYMGLNFDGVKSYVGESILLNSEKLALESCTAFINNRSKV